MENDSKAKLEEISDKIIHLSNENKMKRRGKILRKFFKRSNNEIKNKIIKYEDINSNDKKEENNQSIKKIRNPGVDLARIIAMFIVVITHYIYYGKPSKLFPKYKRQISFLECLTDFHNDEFILISGIVGYKTNKYSNLFYLWLTVFFYSVGIHKYYSYRKNVYFISHDIYKEYYPIVSRRYWYFTIYFGMYLFLPVINKGIGCLTKYEFRLVVISTIGIFTFWRDFKNPREDIFILSVGSSIPWFLAFYLTGAYIAKYRIDYTGIKRYIYCFICLLIFYVDSVLYYKALVNELYFKIGNFKIELPIVFKRIINGRYDSLVKVIQSISVCLFCLQIPYNKYIAKVICFVGPLAFGVYLFHMHNLVKRNVVMHAFDNQPADLSFNSILSIIFIKSCKMFVICIIIDYLRNLLFSFLKIKKILIFIETKMKEKLS